MHPDRQDSISFHRVEVRHAVDWEFSWGGGGRQVGGRGVEGNAGGIYFANVAYHFHLTYHHETFQRLKKRSTCSCLSSQGWALLFPFRFTRSYTFNFDVASPLPSFLPSRFNSLQLHPLLEQDDPKDKTALMGSSCRFWLFSIIIILQTLRLLNLNAILYWGYFFQLMHNVEHTHLF